ncbi:MAG: SGNH/GDSL hydrolase family protein [Desulfomicrobium sp.]|nr:SGNH/GDSL hydrolase family protein [Pseudomonadota bacterium]MBV1713997.1 SGNH/GDSL hydrolase family protein [Desulfomicrobium sp.]MBU4571534.1 SGNH/GDSL hydrolase family protein [Pseudomonadota bacterium]MBU4595682.1 SGNH/GDSL hydrolase family protein [Pseudomonadota bacterium]MBV1721600.1 SGNH/GDSL hydrolase family protein [Desulfomicrobium sp.]
MKKYIKKFLLISQNAFFVLLITAFMLELCSFLYIRYADTNVPLPTYSFINAGSNFWTYCSPHFGVWHEAGSSYLHHKSCFAVFYTANRWGMRDKERTLEKATAKRAVLLGDSFIEGWGNEAEDRLSDRLEQRTGQEVLNFGTAGGFGTIQEWLQYKHLVKNFDHDVVMLGILPHNDFQDNSYEHGLTKQTIYKPFLVGEYPDYRLVYYKEQMPDERQAFPILKSFDFTLREWSSLYRLVRYLHSFRLRDSSLIPRWLAEQEDRPDGFQSKYYEFTEEEWNIMKYSLERLREECSDRRLIIFTIPSHQDFLRFDGTVAPLTEKLARLSEALDFTYVDLLPAMHSSGFGARDLFFECDDHWSPAGNRVAADILEPYVRNALAQ